MFALSDLAPNLVVEILYGKQPATLTAKKLTAIELPLSWRDQSKALAAA
jgi:hypothetical protein